MDRAKAIDRIRKLLQPGGNENETAAKAALAVKLMAKHGIESIDEVEAEANPVGVNEEHAVEISNGERYARWRWQLAWAVAVPMLCKILALHRRVEDKITATLVTFVGRRSDAQACSYIFRYLLDELQRRREVDRPRFRPPSGLAKDELLELARNHKKYLRNWTRDFYLAAVEVIRQRLAAAHQEVVREASSTALVRLDTVRHEIDAIAAEFGVSWETARDVQVRTDGAAYGIRAGRSIDLDRDRTPLKRGQGQLPDGAPEDP